MVSRNLKCPPKRGQGFLGAFKISGVHYGSQFRCVNLKKKRGLLRLSVQLVIKHSRLLVIEKLYIHE